MKKIAILLIAIVLSVGCQSSVKNKVKRYQLKSGMVKYTSVISGRMMGSAVTGKGVESLFFKDFGAVELKEEESTQTTVTKAFGVENRDVQNTHTINKLENNTSYLVDFDAQIIYKNQDMAMTMVSQLHPDGDAESVGKDIFQGMGGQKIGDEKILGYDCEIWLLAGVKQWIYKGVMLKSEATVMGITTTTVAQIAKFNTDISDDNFKLPDFPVQNQGMSNDEPLYEDDMEDMDAQMEKISKMSFQEWKKMALEDDQEMQQMSEDELRQTFDMIQNMIKRRRK